MNERIHLRVRGRVQGVFYRASAQARAHELGLAGWVRNEPTGSVELLAEGPAAALDQLVAWCRVGPPSAEVETVETLERGPARGELGAFAVRR